MWKERPVDDKNGVLEHSEFYLSNNADYYYDYIYDSHPVDYKTADMTLAFICALPTCLLVSTKSNKHCFCLVKNGIMA
jgi:hypothetical protein